MRLLILGTGDQAMVAARTADANGLAVVGHLGRSPGRIDPARHIEGDCADPAAIAAAVAASGAQAVHVAFGDNGFRRAALSACAAADVEIATLILPSAVVDPSAEIEPGVFIGPGAVIGPDARLDLGALVNSGAVIEHDCALGPCSAVFSGATLGGTVVLEALAMVGLGASVIQGARIGPGCIVGAGAAVVGDLPALSVCVGVPARVARARGEDEAFL